jgi:hypothetical protein
MTEFSDQDLKGSHFTKVDLSGSVLREVDFSDSRFVEVDLSRVVMRGVMVEDVAISGLIKSMTVNGVDIAPLLEAALNERYPDRAKMKPEDAAGFREAWDVVERLWESTVERARRLDPALLHESVDDEWSFIQTLRHLVFATDSWVRRAILGDPAPWHPLGLPWGEITDTMGMPHDFDARPPLDEVLALRRERMATVRQVVDGLTDAMLDDVPPQVDAPGWPPPRCEYSVRRCLRVILNEEWEHRLFAERDLDALEGRSS